MSGGSTLPPLYSEMSRLKILWHLCAGEIPIRVPGNIGTGGKLIIGLSYNEHINTPSQPPTHSTGASSHLVVRSTRHTVKSSHNKVSQSTYQT